MSYYMISYGLLDIEEIHFGETKEAAVANARAMINGWPEYADCSDEEILDLLENETVMEFDLVEIPEAMPAPGTPLKDLIAIYNKYWSGQ